MSAFGPYLVHPAAEWFPLLEGDRYDAFVEDIGKHGQIDPILLTADGTTILDGRNRWRACDELGIDPKIELSETEDDDEICRLIFSRNFQRRNLTKVDRDRALAARVAYWEETLKDDDGGANRIAPQHEGVSGTSSRVKPRPNSMSKKSRAVQQVAKESGMSGSSIERAARKHLPKPKPAVPPPPMKRALRARPDPDTEILKEMLELANKLSGNEPTQEGKLIFNEIVDMLQVRLPHRQADNE